MDLETLWTSINSALQSPAGVVLGDVLLGTTGGPIASLLQDLGVAATGLGITGATATPTPALPAFLTSPQSIALSGTCKLPTPGAPTPFSVSVTFVAAASGSAVDFTAVITIPAA